MTIKKRTWTVRELAMLLTTLPQDIPVTLLDADTGYNIDKFAIANDATEVTFLPCDYTEMRK